MVREEDFQKVLNFKIEQYDLLLKNKINPVDFGYKTYFFLRQNRLKPEKKPHDLKSIIYNYFYWLAKIERYITGERELAKYGVENLDKLNEIIVLGSSDVFIGASCSMNDGNMKRSPSLTLGLNMGGTKSIGAGYGL